MGKAGVRNAASAGAQSAVQVALARADMARMTSKAMEYFIKVVTALIFVHNYGRRRRSCAAAAGAPDVLEYSRETGEPAQAAAGGPGWADTVLCVAADRRPPRMRLHRHCG